MVYVKMVNYAKDVCHHYCSAVKRNSQYVYVELENRRPLKVQQNIE